LYSNPSFPHFTTLQLTSPHLTFYLNIGQEEYYIHYIDFNKRLDEWVTLDKMDLSRGIEPPVAAAAAEGKKRKVDADGKAVAPGRKKKKKSGVNSNADSVEPSAPADVTNEKEPSSSKDTKDGKGDDASGTNADESLLQKEIEQLRRGGSMTQRPEEVSRVRTISTIQMGQHIVDTWYFAPYPEEFGHRGDMVHICEFCLRYFGCYKSICRHRIKCNLKHPPGHEIYRKDNLSFWEIDGHKQKSYCRNLCLLSKLFLDHKTLYYDVDPFLFYILTESDSKGCHIVGYFSKEKESLDGYNVACILTLPQHQRKGYGKLLISFSYELSKREKKLYVIMSFNKVMMCAFIRGSPEKPLSDLGLLSYRSYWSDAIVGILKEYHGEITLDELSAKTAITHDDLMHTIHALDLLKYHKGQYIICLGEKNLSDYERSMAKQKTFVDPSCLHWSPPFFTASQLRYL
jgi:histone acetyltransferase HTATIP